MPDTTATPSATGTNGDHATVDAHIERQNARRRARGEPSPKLGVRRPRLIQQEPERVELDGRTLEMAEVPNPAGVAMIFKSSTAHRPLEPEEVEHDREIGRAKLHQIDQAARRGDYSPATAPTFAAAMRACTLLPAQAGPRPRERRETGRRRTAGAQPSSAKSGDSGSDDPEHHPAARTCEWCGGDISHKNADARHCDDKCRVYANRARDRANPDRVADRHALNGVSGTAKPCGCEPKGNLVDRGVCMVCGRDRGRAAASWLFDPAPTSRQLVVFGSTRHRPRYGGRKRKPVTTRKAVAA